MGRNMKVRSKEFWARRMKVRVRRKKKAATMPLATGENTHEMTTDEMPLTGKSLDLSISCQMTQSLPCATRPKPTRPLHTRATPSASGRSCWAPGTWRGSGGRGRTR